MEHKVCGKFVEILLLFMLSIMWQLIFDIKADVFDYQKRQEKSMAIIGMVQTFIENATTTAQA
jgi:hypothetical protein